MWQDKPEEPTQEMITETAEASEADAVGEQLLRATDELARLHRRLLLLFLAIAIADIAVLPLPWAIALAILIVLSVYTVVVVVRIMRILQMSIVLVALVPIPVLLPLINLPTILIVRSQLGKLLRMAGRDFGFLGAK